MRNTLRLGPGLFDPITERRVPQAIPAMNLVADKAYTTAPAAGAIGHPWVGDGAGVQRPMQYRNPRAQKPVSGVEERGRLPYEYAAGVYNLQ